MWDVINNVIQIFNEAVVIVCIWLMFLFTEYVPEPLVRYEFGENLMYFIGVDVGLNILILFKVIGSKIFKACRGFFLRRKAKQMENLRVENKKLLS